MSRRFNDHHLNTSIDLEAACERAAAARLDQLPLFRGAADGKHAFAIVNAPNLAWPSRVKNWLKPAVVLIGDDPYPADESVGPDAWACARGAKRWASYAIVHGTGSHISHYRAASFAAMVHRRLVFVETDTAHLEEWCSFFDCPVMRFVPPPGRSHPSPVQEVMQ